MHNARFRAAHPLEDCATPAWVGHGRWLLLDLSAYRADYGPDLDYAGEPVPPLAPEWSAWADRLLKAKGLRPA